MPESRDRQTATEAPPTARVSLAEDTVRLEGSTAPVAGRETRVSPTTLTSIRGIPAHESKSLAAVLDDPAVRSDPALAAVYTELGSIYRDELKQLWLVARLDPALDRGAELSKLLRLFCEDQTLRAHPELLSQLYKIATAESLFGLTREQYSERGIDFNKIRREFLVDTIRGVINTDNITQGKEPLCTIGASCKLLPKAEFLRLTTEYALHGSVTTASGDEMRLFPQFVERAYASSEATLGEVKCARRSAGMLMVFYGMLQLGDTAANPALPLVERQQGLYWHQYTRAVEKLLNERIACAHRTARDISIDPATGHAVSEDSAANTKQVGLFAYVEEQLSRGRPVFIDTRFNFSSSSLSSGSEHQRHALVAEKIEIRGGQRWVRCSNPIGDFVDTSKSTENHAEFFPPGTILGDRRGFWFETAQNGDILVRTDVLQRNLQTALVQYGTPSSGDPGAQPQFIGDLEASKTGPVFYFDFSEEIAPMSSEPVAVVIHQALDQLFSAREAPTIREPQDESITIDRSAPRRDIVKRKSLEEELLAANATLLLEQQREEKRDERKQDADTVTSSPQGPRVGTNERTVVGTAFEYGRDGGREAVAPRSGDATITTAITPDGVADAVAAPKQAPAPSGASTTVVGLKALFG